MGRRSLVNWLPRRERRRRGAPSAQPAGDPAPPRVQLPVVPFLPVRCPLCRADKAIKNNGTVVTEGGRRVRYHQCETCGQRFKSVEIER